MTAPDTKANVLVVEDDANLRELLSDTLDALGYRAFEAGDGIEALQKLKEEQIDLVISDIKMPGLDGVALLRKIRRYYPNLPVIFITGAASPEIIGRASPDGFLAKPFRIAHLEELIADALTGKTEPAVKPIRKVMVVDDDDLFRDMLADALRYDDYIPVAVPSGEAALKELERGTVDAVIADIKMPGMDGITLLKKIKEKSPELPVILITAFFSQDEASQKSGATQADGFLQKPFKLDNIVRLLKQISLTATENSPDSP
jgi:CheY-like chemotaxis protein